MNYLQTSFWKLLDRSEEYALDETAIKSALEGLLFVSGSLGITVKQAAEVLELPALEVQDLMYDLQSEYNHYARGIQIIELAGTFQFATRVEHARYFEKLAEDPHHSGLSTASLETMAIVAYRQPITRLEIEELRGVKSDRILQTLVQKQLICEVGRAPGPGRPILYGTTKQFLEFFGLKDLSGLPTPSFDQLNPVIDDEVRMLFSKGESSEDQN